MDQRSLNPSQNDAQRLYRAVQDLCMGIDPETIIDVLCGSIAVQVAVRIKENDRPRTLRQIDAYIRQCVRDYTKALQDMRDGEREVTIGDTRISIRVVPD